MCKWRRFLGFPVSVSKGHRLSASSSSAWLLAAAVQKALALGAGLLKTNSAYHMALDGISSIRDSQATAEMTFFAGLLFCLLSSLLSSSWAEAPQAKVQAKSRCPSGAFSYKEGVAWFCYEFYGYQLPFEDAEAICQQSRSGGHLASIPSATQMRLMGGYVSQVNQGKGEVWIGLHRHQNSDMARGWRWTDGSFFSYTNWLGGTPNNIGGRQLCVVLTPGSGFRSWDDATCSYGRSFLCKWRAP
ncbi:dromaiocalcin-1-like [Heteronotia binoei]|uniref:dromaiocalcin-1-like n=1 Tax=Heteronotia binoei TaxID=13085 RepID=UPI00292EDFE0|nr:dromaiocalcin-1-like [Heteronotia binoei]